MQHVCVLISKPGADAVDVGLVRDVCDALDTPSAAGRYLAVEEAFEIETPSLPSQGVAEARADLVGTLRGLAGDRPLDIAVVPVNHRRKHLVIADMDSTMIEQECIDELADALGLKDRVAAITERAMRGEIEFEPAVRERVRLLKGLSRADIERVARERITFSPGALTFVRTMRVLGAYTALVSGGFSLFTAIVGDALGFHTHQANELLFEGDVLSGTVREPILGRDAKRAALHDLVRDHNLSREQALAVGDGANDLAMLEEAGLGVAYRAKPAVAEAADVRIDHGDLTALLYLQGIARDEFAEE